MGLPELCFVGMNNRNRLNINFTTFSETNWDTSQNVKQSKQKRKNTRWYDPSTLLGQISEIVYYLFHY